jgi:hypothetical protein
MLSPPPQSGRSWSLSRLTNGKSGHQKITDPGQILREKKNNQVTADFIRAKENQTYIRSTSEQTDQHKFVGPTELETDQAICTQEKHRGRKNPTSVSTIVK